jgi:hypothetical protein
MPSSKRTTGGEPVATILPNGDREWRLEGKLHRPDGKLAIEYAQGGGECWLHGEHLFTAPPPNREDWREVRGEPIVSTRLNGDTEWRVQGKLHREDGPAVEYTRGGGEWWLHGVNHREDGPAAIFPDGSWGWYKNGHLHRDDGPALWEPSGRMAWYRNGSPHREDGPAGFHPGLGWFWALDGRIFSREEAFRDALAVRQERATDDV